MKMNSAKYLAKVRSAISQITVASFTTAALLMVLFAPVNPAFGQKYSDWSAPVNLGPTINTTGFDGCPSVTKDGLTLLFMSNIGSTAQNIYVAHRKTREDAWGEVEPLAGINTPTFTEGCPMLTISGRYLYFMSNRPGGCGDTDIWVARRLNKENFTEWDEPEHLGCQVNSAGPEFSPSLLEAEDGTVYLYFSSGLRPGGMGFGDIYVTQQLADGSFGPVAPVSEFNTVFNEIRPKIRQRDGLEIFFDSNRPGGAGVDIYTSTRDCVLCGWAPPDNLGSVVNSPAIDGGPALSFDGTELYFMSNRPDGSGDQDIYVTRRHKLRGDPVD
jgi:Tol biopolymer transport system component